MMSQLFSWLFCCTSAPILLIFLIRLTSTLVEQEGNNEGIGETNCIRGGKIMRKYLQTFSIVFLGICIVFGSWLISQSLITNHEEIETTETEQSKYEFVTIASDYFIIFDNQKGEYW